MWLWGKMIAGVAVRASLPSGGGEIKVGLPLQTQWLRQVGDHQFYNSRHKPNFFLQAAVISK